MLGSLEAEDTHFTDEEPEASAHVCRAPRDLSRSHVLREILTPVPPSCACVPILRLRQGFSALALLTFWGQILICDEGNPHRPPTSLVAQMVKHLPTVEET